MDAGGHLQFERAAEEFAAHPTSHEAIAEIMALAIDGDCLKLRQWAAVWLRQHCDIQITARTEDQDNATAATAGNLL
jgi:hypothetical protein